MFARQRLNPAHGSVEVTNFHFVKDDAEKAFPQNKSLVDRTKRPPESRTVYNKTQSPFVLGSIWTL